MDNLIGKRLDGRYLIGNLIGVGGMANVYRGKDTKTGNAVAVKILKEEFLDNEELVRRFKNESKAISILDHPNIVKVYDVSVTDKLQYIVMEYVDGITLKEYLKQRGGPLTWKEAVHFATQVLSALQHAHSKGIIHRDVKPQNIMLLADGSIKMMDFGIARLSRAQSQTVSDKAIGSVHYISPEQAKGDRTDARTDIYSVGIMLYEMLSGKLPFDGDGAVSIAIMQIADKAKPLSEVAPNVPEGLCQITAKAMEKDPARRYASAQDMLLAIEEFKRNPSIKFAYEYQNSDAPGKTINKVVNNAKSRAKTPARTPGAGATGSIRTGEARRAGTQNPGGGKKRTKKKSRGGFSVFPIFLGMATAFVIGGAILCYLIFANSDNALFSHKKDVTLINFVGMTEDEFRASDYMTQVRSIFVQEYNSEYPEGTIFFQTPRAGRTVKEGQKLTLKVSLGTEWVPVPETAGMSRADAEELLKSRGLTVQSYPIQEDSVATNTVVYTQPAAGETVMGGSTITMYVSTPKIKTERTVPSLAGKMVDAARTELAAQNLIAKVVQQVSGEPEGTVLSQSPVGGTQVKMNTPVTLYVSTGITQEEIDAAAAAAAAEQAAQEGWWDQDENGNWYHVGPDGQPDGQ